MRREAHPAAMTPPPNHRYLLSRLQREWNVLSNRPSVVRRAAAWKLTPVVLISLDDLLVLTGLGTGPHASRRTTRRWAGWSRWHGTTIWQRGWCLQRMLPGLSACAKRNSQSFDSRLDALDELLSEAWTVIRSFPIEQRNRYVIKNLLRDCEYRAFVKVRRRMLVHELTDPAHFDLAIDPDECDGEPLATLVELLGRARAAGMSEDDLTMVTTLLNTSTVKQAAAALRVTDRTIRNRRHAVVRQLQALADVA